MIRKTKFKYSILTAVGGLTLLGSVVGAGASDGNLLQNGEFLDGTWHWTAADETARFGATEIQSMYLMNAASADAGLPAIVYQCVEVSEGARYDFRADVTIPTKQQRRTGAAQLATYWWDGENCEGSLLATMHGEPVRQSTAGISHQSIAPEGARSAWAAMIATQDPAAPKDGEQPFSTLWDDVYFGPPEEQPGDEAAGADAQDEPAADVQQSFDSNDEPASDAGGMDLMLAAGIVGAAVAVVAGGAVLLPARRKR